ncbi:MAG: amino acid adenylation domain-containing protein, partial [Herpetosiphonaceae bacterium]|nr:amino acid adenylation domain-containing protein [Herpetosiphonaceae bacterium]
LTGAVRDQQLAYWQQQLAGPLPVLDLPTDHPRPAIQTFHGATVSLMLPPALATALTQFSQEAEATLFMTLLAAFQTLLYRYSGQTDLLIGSPIAGRTRAETEGLIGFFVNTLVLRTDLGGNPSFRELLARVRDMALQAYAHQDLPFEMVVEAVQPARDLSRSPLFQVMVVFQNLPPTTLNLPDLQLTQLAVIPPIAKFDLTLTLTENQEGLGAHLEYNTELFEAATMERLLTHFHTLLDGIVADPDQRLASLPLLPQAQWEQVVHSWNDTAVPYPPAFIHRLFEQQVEQTPDAVALVFETQQLSYRELNRRANRLAHYLQARGVGPEVRVGICMHRSCELVIGLLAILKAGGAYVPLDPSYPAERLAYMLADSHVAVILTQQELVAVLPTQTAPVVCLDTDASLRADLSATNPTPPLAPNNLAYVIYTSGSTGQPKGAMNTHRAISNRLQWMQAAYHIDATDRVLQKTPCSFDVSVWEFFWPLMTGACLVIAKPEGHKDSAYLVALIQTTAITTLHFVPSMLQVFLDEPQVTQCTSLRQVICSGEALSLEQQTRCLGQVPQAALHNLYGPTEAAVDVTWWTCDVKEQHNSVPIGRPISNTQIYVLDQHFQPMPAGVPGELYIGGVNLGRGYFDQPTLTAERFVPDPFSTTLGARLYRTGDLARWLPDGVVEYLGRLDHQVKLRGFRIELGEIETLLLAHPNVQACVVVAREDRPGDQRLVAYVVTQPGQSLIDEQALREWLQTTLPEYMLPSAFVVLDQLPLTPNGKLDRRALPAPAETAPAASFVAPRTPLEQQLANMWGEVLDRSPIGVTDNFFALGGHSLLATQLVQRLRTALKVEVPLRALFEHPTIAALAAHLALLHTLTLEPSLQPVPRDGVLPLSFAQQRLWFLDQLEPGTATYTIPAALRLHGQLDDAALEHSFTTLVARHEVLRTTFPLVDGQPVQYIAPPAPCPISRVDLQAVPAEQREAEAHRLAQVEIQRPFDLAQGPLIRIALLRLSSDDHVLVLALHHSISDGWSTSVLVRELAIAYLAFHQGQVPELPPLPIQYADYAVWQRGWLTGAVRDQQLAYWQQQLRGPLPVLDLPTDHPRPPIQTFHGATVTLMLPPALATALSQFSQEAEATLFMTLLAAFQTLLYRYTGQTDLLIGSPIAGRTRAETEGLIGFFVNTLVLRTDLGGNPPFRELLARTRDTALQAYDHQDLPFEMVVEAVQPARDLSRSPLFQVMLVLQNLPPATLELPQLQLTSLQLETGVAKFDLTLGMVDSLTGLEATLEYNTELFEAATMERLLTHFHTLLDGIVADPEQRITDLPLLPQAQWEQVVHSWNDTAVPYPPAFIHRLFEQQVEQTPDATAVVFETQQLSYRDLNTRANQLAHYLQTRGVGPDVRVGICMHRSCDLVIGLLAILKAGGAYVPLDPSYPAERLAYMLADSHVAVILTQEELVAALATHSAPVVCLDTDASIRTDLSATNPTPPLAPDNLAYVIYTSGSTGQPKGSMVPHRGLVNYVLWSTQAYQLAAGTGTVVHSSIAFDLTVTGLFGPLLVGQTVFLAAEEQGIEALGAAMRQRTNLSLLKITPAHLELLKQQLTAAEARDRTRAFIIGGEQLRAEQVAWWQTHAPATVLVNEYGPTETVVGCCVYVVPHDHAQSGALPIGRPIANTQLYVLDQQGQPAPVGVPGEVYIGGVQVTRGYLNRPDLTAERFVPDPFSMALGARLYRTGDMARWLPDGIIEYLGRLDHQVKLRGFRIELGEIEAVLLAHPNVQACVVAVREDRPGDQRLVAYLVPHDHAVSHAAYRDWLATRVPDYMIPAMFMCLAALPLTPNGKLDRRALPAPEYQRQAHDHGNVVPRDHYELRLIHIWEELLGVETPSVTDDFFALGGHSLLALRLMTQVEQAFGRKLPLASLFQYATIERLAELLRHQPDHQPWSPLVAIQPNGTRPPLFCVHPIGGTVLCYRELAQLLGADQPCYGLQAPGIDDQQPPIADITELARLYIAALRTLQPHGPYYLSGWSFGGVVAFEMAQQLQQQAEVVALLAVIDSTAPTANEAPLDDTTLLAYFAQDLGALFGQHLPITVETLRRLPVDQQLAYVLAQVREHNVVPPDIDPQDIARHFAGFKAHMEAARSYVPQPYPGHLAFFQAHDSLLAEADDTAAWDVLAHGGISRYKVAGNHYTLLHQPQVQTLADYLTASLTKPGFVGEE